jgi:hypothetical protein
MTRERLLRKAGGAALVLVGAVMIVTPGPGIPLILLGLHSLGEDESQPRTD